MNLVPYCFNEDDLWTFERATEPSDINWENLGVGVIRRFCQTIFSYFITFCLLGICALIIWAIKERETAYRLNNKITKDTPMRQQGFIKFLSVMSSLSINIINFILKLFMRSITVNERHSSTTALNVSIAFKLTVCRFLNSSILLLILNWGEPTRWFNNGQLVYEASVLLALMALTNPVVVLMDPNKRLKQI